MEPSGAVRGTQRTTLVCPHRRPGAPHAGPRPGWRDGGGERSPRPAWGGSEGGELASEWGGWEWRPRGRPTAGPLCPLCPCAPAHAVPPARRTSLVGTGTIRAGGPAGRRGGERRARGECSNKRFISETKAYFFGQDCSCGYPMTQRLGRGPGGGPHGAAQPLSAAPLSPRLLIWSWTSKWGFARRNDGGTQTAHQRRKDEKTPQLAPWRAGGLRERGRS